MLLAAFEAPAFPFASVASFSNIYCVVFILVIILVVPILRHGLPSSVRRMRRYDRGRAIGLLRNVPVDCGARHRRLAVPRVLLAARERQGPLARTRIFKELPGGDSIISPRACGSSRVSHSLRGARQSCRYCVHYLPRACSLRQLPIESYRPYARCSGQSSPRRTVTSASGRRRLLRQFRRVCDDCRRDRPRQRPAHRS